MREFVKKPVVIMASQWHKNGDHEGDNAFRPFEDTGIIPTEPREGLVVRYFRRPDVPGEQVCKHCGWTMHIHGWIDTPGGGHTVCPGDFIITGTNGEHYPLAPDKFHAKYEPVNEYVAKGGHE